MMCVRMVGVMCGGDGNDVWVGVMGVMCGGDGSDVWV